MNGSTRWIACGLVLLGVAGCKSNDRVAGPVDRSVEPAPYEPAPYESEAGVVEVSPEGEQPAPAPEPQAEPVPTITFEPEPEPEPQPSAQPAPQPAGTYTVQRGDTLWSIAKQVYGDGKRWQDIAAANGIADPTQLKAGQKLTLP